jgi:hypothetical protein
MAIAMVEIQGLESKQPLFKEFCKINKLSEGSFYKATDYIFWVDKLSIGEQLAIIRKYQPNYKMKNCNL